MLKFLPPRKTAPQGETQEMILLTLARAEENAHPLSPADLSTELNLPRVDIDNQLLLLAAQGFLTDTFALTDAGRERARALLRRHRLAERLFTDVLGLDWARAHEEADRIEHIVSPEAEQQLAHQLGNPETCPHGNPIPNASHSPAPSTAEPLTACEPLTRATITRIGIETPAALQHLAALGLLPSVEIEIEKKAPFDGPVMVRVGRAHYALGRDLAQRIWVQRTN